MRVLHVQNPNQTEESADPFLSFFIPARAPELIYKKFISKSGLALILLVLN